MLTTILNNVSSTKCVLIEDSLLLPAKQILRSTLKKYLETKAHNVHVIVYEMSTKKFLNSIHSDRLIIHDFTVDSEGWENDSSAIDLIETTNKLDGVIMIDSLVYVIMKYGLSQTYRLIHDLINKVNGIVQVFSILHSDTLINSVHTIKCLAHLSGLYVRLVPKSEKNHVEYTYRKPGGKIIKKLEEFYIQNEILYTQTIQKNDVEKMLALSGNLNDEMPENLTTFKISLDENEKRSREQLVLPYTKQQQVSSSHGNIHYECDDLDDWDEEDLFND